MAQSESQPVAQSELPTPPDDRERETTQNDIVEVDTFDSDNDSSYDFDDAGSSSTSIVSSVFNYTYENGRRYQTADYPMPNDEKEQDRLDLKHHVFKLILGGRLFCAPIPANPQRILDVGTGTGIWAIEVADEFPSAEVIGIDLSPIQPSWVPPNCRFIVDNAEEEWIYGPSKAFDFIHWRVLAGSINDWPRLYEQAYDNVKPGGWIEAQEHGVQIYSDDNTVENAKDLEKFFAKVDEASVKAGRPMATVAENQKQWMINAGFVDVHEEIHKVPIGRWPKDRRLKEMGMFFQAQCVDAVESISMKLFTRVLGYTPEAAQLMMIGPRNDMKNPAAHVYMKFHFVYGRKPLPNEQLKANK